MKKILIILALLIGFMWSIAFVLLPQIETRIDTMTFVTASGSSSEVITIEDPISIEQKEKIKNKDIVRKRIETIRKRLALK
jgi:hypothetical protein